MSQPPNKLFTFGDFRLDSVEKLLWKNEKSVSLPPKVMDILCLLVENQGRIVSKNEIMETIWTDSFVEESNLTQSIYTLRRILESDAEGKSLIETVPRRGFRISIPITHEPADSPSVETRLNPVSINPRFNRKNKTLLGILVASLVVGTIAFVAFKTISTEKPISSPLENVSFEKLTFTGDISFPVISPDGKSFAFVRDESLYLQDVNTGSNFKLNIPEHSIFGNLQFSVDNESIYFRDETSFDAGGHLFQVSRFGGNAKKIVDNIWSTPGFSPDGKKIAFMRFSPPQARWILIVKTIESGEEKELLWRDSPETLYRSGFPAWSFDGKKIATVEQTANQKKISNLIIVNAETGKHETIDTKRLLQIEQVAWQPNDAGIVLVGREDNRFFQLWKVAYPSGDLQKITNDLSIYRTLSLSADGSKLLARQQLIYSHIWTAAAENLESQKQITYGNLNRDGVNDGMALTSDGGNLIYSSRITGNVDLWTVRLADGFRTQLTENAGTINESPVLSADGRFIYFSSTRNGTRHIWRIDLNGENPIQVTFSDKETESYPSISPDGNWLYFIKKAAQRNSIWRKSLADERLEQVTEPAQFAPNSFLAFSPDGKWLAFNNFIEKENAAGERLQVAMIPVGFSGKPKFFNIPATVAKIVWSADGSAFDFIENSGKTAKLWRQPIGENEEAKVILTMPGALLNDIIWTTGGKNIVIARGKQESDVMLFRNF